MNSYQNDLINFINDIKNKTIKQNEVVIGEFNEKVILILNEKQIDYDKNIFLSVRRYNHIIREFKKSKGKSVPEELVQNFHLYIANPKKIYFDNLKKHNNLIYLFEENNKLYKIIINPNGEIVTAGIANIGNLEKDSLFEEIKR